MSKLRDTKKKLPPLWKCPKCGHEFVTRNLRHSCSHYKMDHHFKGRDPVLRKIFDKWEGAVRKCGPITVISQKTRIVFTVRVRFASVMIRKNWVEVGLWLSREVRHPRLHHMAKYMQGCYYHYFRFEKPADIDRAFGPWLRESYAIGCQKNEGP